MVQFYNYTAKQFIIFLTHRIFIVVVAIILILGLYLQITFDQPGKCAAGCLLSLL